MKLKLYFDHDKIVAQGSIITPGGYFPKEVFSGIVVIRIYDNTHYELSLNKCIEEEVLNIHNKGGPGARSKIYNIIGTREPVAYNLLIDRIVAENNTLKTIKNYYFLWKEMFSQGVYSQTCAEDNLILDKAVYDKFLEYDNNGYYSIARSFVERIKQKKSYIVKDAMEIIQCPDDMMTISFFENIGYTWKKGKLIRNKDIDDLFNQ